MTEGIHQCTFSRDFRAIATRVTDPLCECDNALMTQSDTEPRESSDSGQERSRWCFVLDTAGRIVHTVETAAAANLAVTTDPTATEPCRLPPVPMSTLNRPTFDAPWWTVAVENVDRHAAGRIALALVEDDRAAYGMPETAFEPAAEAATPAPTVLGVDAGGFAEVYTAIEEAQCCQGPAPEREFSRTSLVITGVSDGARELVRRSDEFARVRTYRGYLDHATEIAAPTEDVRLLVEQAEFWQGQFAETYNRSSETIIELEAELAAYREAEEPDEDEEEPDERYFGGVKPCHAIPCGEPQEVMFEFQEATWEVTFDLNGTYVGMRYGDHLKGEPLPPGAGPVVSRPDTVGYPAWFTVAVRATNSASAVELARATLVEREGITGNVFAVMDGTSTVEESGASAAQLAWAYKWTQEQLDIAEAQAAGLRTNIERLTQAEAGA